MVRPARWRPCQAADLRAVLPRDFEASSPNLPLAVTHGSRTRGDKKMSSTLGRLTAIVALMVAPTSSNPTRMGWFSPCLPAADVPRSLAYYESIGFYQTGGDPEHGWVTLACGATELALMSFLQTPLLALLVQRGDQRPNLTNHRRKQNQPNHAHKHIKPAL